MYSLTLTTPAFGATNPAADGNPRPTAATTAHVLILPAFFKLAFGPGGLWQRVRAALKQQRKRGSDHTHEREREERVGLSHRARKGGTWRYYHEQIATIPSMKIYFGALHDDLAVGSCGALPRASLFSLCSCCVLLPRLCTSRWQVRMSSSAPASPQHNAGKQVCGTVCR